MTQEKSHFIDNNDGTITDSNTDLMWTKEDSWLMEGRWVSWDEALEFSHTLGYQKFAGFNDWRLPEQQELLSLVEPTKTIKDKYGKDLKLDPAFAEGSLATVWTKEGIGQDGYIVNFNSGEVSILYKSKTGRMAVRPVRGTPFSERSQRSSKK